MQGLRRAITHEKAFQQEFVLYLLLLIPLYYIPVSAAFKGLLFLSNTVVLIVELLNSAIEATVDLVTPEYHELAGGAKDYGSAAAFLSQVATVALWGWAIVQVYLKHISS